MDALKKQSVDLVITSPPYPMIKMWDALFADQHSAIGKALRNSDGQRAFELMHRELDAIWQEVWRNIFDLRPDGSLDEWIAALERQLGAIDPDLIPA